MLTATYSLVAIAAEQEKARSKLHKLQQYIHSAWKGLQNIDFGFLETAFNKMSQFDKYCRNRKIEMYLIPALRTANREAEQLIAELEAITVTGVGILRAVGEQLTNSFVAGRVRIGEICQAMQVYCHKASVRLEKEEQELLPMARRLLSTEEWFAIAAQFLADAPDAYGRRRPQHMMPLAAEQLSAANMHMH